MEVMEDLFSVTWLYPLRWIMMIFCGKDRNRKPCQHSPPLYVIHHHSQA